MNKADLIKALEPFADDVTIDLASGPYCSMAYRAVSEMVDGRAHVVLCADQMAVNLIHHRTHTQKAAKTSTSEG